MQYQYVIFLQTPEPAPDIDKYLLNCPPIILTDVLGFLSLPLLYWPTRQYR